MYKLTKLYQHQKCVINPFYKIYNRELNTTVLHNIIFI